MGRKQVPVPLKQALDELVIEDEPAIGQSLDSNQMETIMNMLVAISSRCQATEDDMQQITEKAEHTLSPDTSRAN